MELLDLDSVPGVFCFMLEFLGANNEYCLALTSKEMLVTVAQTHNPHVGGEKASDILLTIEGMSISQLKDALEERECSVEGSQEQLSLRLAASGLQRRSVMYFMSTPALCSYARDSLRLLEGKTEMDRILLMMTVAGQGLLPGMQMLRRLEPPTPWGEGTCMSAARGGHLSLLQWMREPDKPEGQCPWDAATCAKAAKFGHLELLQWLRQPKSPTGQCPWDEWACHNAAAEGRLDLLQWLRRPDKLEGQCPWDATTCAKAAERGDIDMLKWLRRADKPEGQCPWKECSCQYAAREGHLETLKWLRLQEKPEGQCPWHEYSCQYAAEGGHLEVLRWLRDGETPCPWSRPECLLWCVHEETRDWIKSQPD
jgi:hypothetical protein